MGLRTVQTITIKSINYSVFKVRVVKHLLADDRMEITFDCKDEQHQQNLIQLIAECGYRILEG